MVVRLLSAPVGFPSSIVLSGVPYYIYPLLKGFVKEPPSGISKPSPAVVVSSRSSNITADELLKVVNEFPKRDDVYSTDFLACLVIQTPPGVKLQSTSLQVHHAEAESEEALLPSGPYFIYENGIYEVWRLYPDDLDTFEITIVPDPSDVAKFSILEALASDGIWRNVAVPSRLYAKYSSEKPLAGLRVSVKDNFKIAGIKTTMTNRAFTELYPADVESAEYVKRLVNLGAIIVGKTRMCSFASGEEPTDQWIDFHCPFNPRGDTYQSPGSSSSGAGASLAGYPWLDFSIGTDSAGSIRVPAANNGVYGLRPSHGSASMDGIFRLARAFDTVGLLGRELGLVYNLARLTLSLADPKKLPTKILYPREYFPQDNASQQAMIDGFVCVLEKHLGVERTEFSFIDRWSECPPTAAKGKPLKEYLAKSTFWQYYYDAYHEYDFFRNDYRRRFERDPYVGPLARFRWEAGAKLSLEQRNQGAAELAIFRDWFQNHVLKPVAGSLSDAILIMPEGKAVPDYRDTPNPPPSILSILGENTVAMVLGIPHLVLPIGQVPYHSRISGRMEYRPICVSLLGAKGSDLMLIKVANDAFQMAGWPTKIQTGRCAFAVGDNERNVL